MEKIINGDCIEALEQIEQGSVDLIFADPPYWLRVDGTLKRADNCPFDGCYDDWDQFSSQESYEGFTRRWLTACRRVLSPNGSIWVIGGMQCIYTIGAIMQELGFWFINDVVWHKKNPTPNFHGTRLNNSHETLIWAVKSPKSKFTFNYKTGKELNTDNVTEEEFLRGIRKQMGSVWRIAVCAGNERLRDASGNKLHSTQKPQELLERIIAISSNVGDLVLDPFGGTMTTATAAKKLGRDYIVIEQNAIYCEAGRRRLEDIRYVENDIATAKLDQKPVKASMADMIQEGFFRVGEYFSFRDGVPVAKLTEDGKLLFDGAIMDIHSCAAKAKGVKAKRLNGFDYWYVHRGSEIKSISEIREDFRKTL